MKSQSFKPIWNLVKEHDNIGRKRPCMRGGHQMCIDSAAGIIYLLGGWDGHKDLSDLWCFIIATGTWRCISINVEENVKLIILYVPNNFIYLLYFILHRVDRVHGHVIRYVLT